MSKLERKADAMKLETIKGITCKVLRYRHRTDGEGWIDYRYISEERSGFAVWSKDEGGFFIRGMFQDSGDAVAFIKDSVLHSQDLKFVSWSTKEETAEQKKIAKLQSQIGFKRENLHKVNAFLKLRGVEEKVVSGGTYYYLIGGSSHTWYNSSVSVFRANQISLNSWYSEIMGMKADAGEPTVQPYGFSLRQIVNEEGSSSLIDWTDAIEIRLHGVKVDTLKFADRPSMKVRLSILRQQMEKPDGELRADQAVKIFYQDLPVLLEEEEKDRVDRMIAENTSDGSYLCMELALLKTGAKLYWLGEQAEEGTGLYIIGYTGKDVEHLWKVIRKYRDASLEEQKSMRLYPEQVSVSTCKHCDDVFVGEGSICLCCKEGMVLKAQDTDRS